MPIEERLMAAGQWSLALDPGIPKATRDILGTGALDGTGYFGHIFIFDSPVRIGLADSTMISLSRWGGIVRRRQTPWSVSGTNMICWLGDEDGKGPFIFTKIGSGGPSTLAGYIGALIGPAKPCPAVTYGNVVAGGPTHQPLYGGTSVGDTPITVRQAIDNLMLIYGAEYRVNKDASIDVQLIGASPSITPRWFNQTPTAVAMRRSSGRDASIVGISTTQLDVSIDAEEYVIRALLKDAGGNFTSGIGTVTPYKDLQGNLVQMTKFFDSPLTPNAVAAATAASLVSAGQVLRNGVTLGSDQFDIPRDVIVGDYIWVYDASGSLVDTANQIRYRGSFIYPMKLRVLAMTWPIERGMSVWYRDQAGIWTDLTNYVLYEQPGVSFEVGAPIRALTKS